MEKSFETFGRSLYRRSTNLKPTSYTKKGTQNIFEYISLLTVEHKPTLSDCQWSQTVHTLDRMINTVDLITD